MRNKVLEKQFFNRKTIKVARDLIDCLLCRKIGSRILKYKITETEAYTGPHDLACHSSKGKTGRNAPMWEDAGTIYIYFVYGMHFMLNIVTEKKGFPSAVLIRGIEKINLHTKNFARNFGVGVNGPGKVTKELKINKELNGKTAKPENCLWFEREGNKKIRIKRTARIGVNYAGPIWANRRYRFALQPTSYHSH